MMVKLSYLCTCKIRLVHSKPVAGCRPTHGAPVTGNTIDQDPRSVPGSRRCARAYHHPRRCTFSVRHTPQPAHLPAKNESQVWVARSLPASHMLPTKSVTNCSNFLPHHTYPPYTNALPQSPESLILCPTPDIPIPYLSVIRIRRAYFGRVNIAHNLYPTLHEEQQLHSAVTSTSTSTPPLPAAAAASAAAVQQPPPHSCSRK